MCALVLLSIHQPALVVHPSPPPFFLPKSADVSQKTWPGKNAYRLRILFAPPFEIVAAGTRFNPGGSSFALARYNHSGALDPTFGGDGRVVTAFPGGALGNGVAIQADGKIVVAGELFRASGETRFALARYLAA
jgi:uncharacterized delta-60 repeat protein